MTIESPAAKAILWAAQNADNDLLLSYAGLDAGPSHVFKFGQGLDSKWYLDQVKHQRDRLVSRGSVGIIDTTTLMRVMRFFDKGSARAARIDAIDYFDLATFVSACVYEDSIFFLEHPNLSIGAVRKLFGNDLFGFIPWKQDEKTSMLLDHLWGHSEVTFGRAIADSNVARRFDQWWSELSGHPVSFEKPREKGGHYRKYFSSIESVAVEMALTDADSAEDSYFSQGGVEFELMEKHAVESTMRGIFYHCLCNVLGATYYSNVFRNWIKPILAEHALAWVDQNGVSLPQKLDDQYRAHLKKSDVLTEPFASPMLLSALVQRSDSVESFLEQLLHIREKAAPLRAARRELEEAVDQGDVTRSAQLFRAVGESAATLSKLQMLAEDCFPCRLFLSIGGARGFLGGLGHLLLMYPGIPNEVRQLLRDRLVKPELWFLTQVAADAQRTTRAYEQFAKLGRQHGASPARSQNHHKLSRELLVRFGKAMQTSGKT